VLKYFFKSKAFNERKEKPGQIFYPPKSPTYPPTPKTKSKDITIIEILSKE